VNVIALSGVFGVFVPKWLDNFALRSAIEARQREIPRRAFDAVLGQCNSVAE
jgi:hypothetical protein